ncbi:hypothetical protein L1887_05371 [Cichorium endivia]|nr:hypothetical protein L1887_05371 [Cichorium endivia]
MKVQLHRDGVCRSLLSVAGVVCDAGEKRAPVLQDLDRPLGNADLAAQSANEVVEVEEQSHDGSDFFEEPRKVTSSKQQNGNNYSMDCGFDSSQHSWAQAVGPNSEECKDDNSGPIEGIGVSIDGENFSPMDSSKPNEDRVMEQTLGKKKKKSSGRSQSMRNLSASCSSSSAVATSVEVVKTIEIGREIGYQMDGLEDAVRSMVEGEGVVEINQ